MQPLAAQIDWTHIQVLIDAFGDSPDLYAWYAAKAAENRWSRRYLKGQIDLRLHEHRGAALSNFPCALEPADADGPLRSHYKRGGPLLRLANHGQLTVRGTWTGEVGLSINPSSSASATGGVTRMDPMGS